MYKCTRLASQVCTDDYIHTHSHAVLVWVCSIGLGYDCVITIAATVLMNYLTWLVVDKTSFLACCGGSSKYEGGAGHLEGAGRDEFSDGRNKGGPKTRGGFGTVHAVRKTSSDEFSSDTSFDVNSDTSAELRQKHNDSDDNEQKYHR